MKQMIHIFRTSLIIGIFITLSQFTLAEKSTLMTFTSFKGQGATKDWVADSCFAIPGENGKITITGRFTTGRTDLPTQDMVLVFSEFSPADTGRYAYITDAYFQEIYTVGGKARYINTKIVLNTVTAKITGFDGDKYVLEGTFAFNMTSYPPTSDPFVTQVYNGNFSAEVDNSLSLEVSPVKEVRINSGKKVNYKLYVKNSIGLIQPDASVFVTDELAKLVGQEVGYTNSAGEYIYTAEIPKDAESKKYKLKFEVEARIGSRKLVADPVERTLNVSGRYWVYSCLGVPLLTFDAGEGKEWKSDDPLETISASGKIMINDLIVCEGTVTIDPREGYEKMSGNHKMYLDGINIAGNKVKLMLSQGIGMAFNCSKYMKYDTPGLLSHQIGGVDFQLDEISFTDLDFGKALKLKGTAYWANLYADNCKVNSNVPESTSVSVAINVVYEELAGFNIDGLELSATNISTAALPGFCIDNLGITYDPLKDAYTFSGAAEYSTTSEDPAKKPFEGKFKASLTVQNGRFEACMFEGKVKPGMPIPDVPFFTWNGLKISTSGWSNKTSWKGVKASLSGFFNSEDELLKEKIPWVKKILPLPDDPLCELEIGGSLEFAGPKITGFATARLFSVKNISVTKKWQLEFSSGFSFDIGKRYFDFGSVDMRAFHFGLEDYFIRTTNRPGLMLKLEPDNVTMQGLGLGVTLRLPDFPSDHPIDPDKPAKSGESKLKFGKMFDVLQYLKVRKYLPRTLGTGAAGFFFNSQDGIRIKGMADVTTCGIPLLSSYGSLSFDIYYDSELGPIFKFGGGFMDLLSSKTMKKEGDAIQDGELVSEYVKAEPMHSFDISDKELRAFIMLTSTTNIPTTTLVTPTGERISATRPDSSIILFESELGTFSQWSIINPEKGRWKIEINSPKQEDSINIFSLNKNKPFEITASSEGNKIIVKWDADDYSVNDYVDVYLDDINTGFTGINMGGAKASDGFFEFTPSDSLPFCNFYIYAYREAASLVSEVVYADGQFSFEKSSIPGPSSITLLSDQYGNCQLTYIPSTNDHITEYGVYIQGMNGNDSLISIGYPEETLLTFSCDTTLLSNLFIVPFNDDGNRGCPIKPESVIVGVGEVEPLSGMPINMDLNIIPNPASELVEFRVTLPVDSGLSIGIYDLLGNKVADFPYTNYSAGYNRIIYNTTGLNQGAYVVRLMSGENVMTKTLMIVR